MNMLWCTVIGLGLLTTGISGLTDFTRVGNITNWPDLANLGAFANNIDWFAKFRERIYLVTKDDRVYVFGNETSTQTLFGVKDGSIKQLAQPTEIVELQNKKIVKFASSEFHVLALSMDGNFYSWGSNEDGQLCVGSNVDHVTPVVIYDYNNAMDIVTVDHASYILTRNGQIFQCGKGNELSSKSPTLLNLQNVQSLYSTYDGTNVAILENSRMYVWGDEKNPRPTILEKQHESVATTFHNYYLLTEDGSIMKSDSDDHLKVDYFYQGSIKFKALYADQSLPSGFLIAETTDGHFWVMQNLIENEDRQLSPATDIVEAFAIHNYNGYTPFMIKLIIETNTSPTSSVPPTTTPFNETCDHYCQLMEKMFNNKTTSNTEFHIEGKTIYVDQQILIAASLYMDKQFAGPWQGQSSITISDYSYRIYYLYLHFLYTDRLDDLVADEAVELYVLAKRLQEENLKQRCLEVITHHTF